MAASVASAAMSHNTATTMKPSRPPPCPEIGFITLKRIMLPCLAAGGPQHRAVGRRSRRHAAGRQLGANDRGGRNCERERGGRIPHTHANRAPKPPRVPPSLPPHAIGTG